MHSAIDATVTGRVQGVMFRDFTRRKANKLNLVGEVENKEDGSVSIYAEGDENNLDTFVALLKKGPFLARVDTVAYTMVKPQGGYASFSIKYD